MEIVCPKCNALYNIPENKIPPRDALMTCKRCQHKIPVKPTFTSNTPPEASGDSPVESPPAPSGNPAPAPHPMEILQVYPEAAEFDSSHYILDEILVPNKKGNYKTGLNRLKLKILKAAQPVLDGLLEKDERVFRVGFGTAYYPLELLFGNGALTMLYNRYALAATDRRLLAINTSAGMKKATHYLFQFPYASIKKVSKGIFGTSLTLIRKQGKKRVFTAIKSGLAGEIKQWLATKIEPGQPMVPGNERYDNLCPACYQPLAVNLTACEGCGAGFKSPRKSALRSLILPGLGDIYLGHRFLGTVELFGAFFIWILALSLLAGGTAETIAMALILLLFFNGMDALLTLHMAKKGYALEKKKA